MAPTFLPNALHLPHLTLLARRERRERRERRRSSGGEVGRRKAGSGHFVGVESPHNDFYFAGDCARDEIATKIVYNNVYDNACIS